MQRKTLIIHFRFILRRSLYKKLKFLKMVQRIFFFVGQNFYFYSLSILTLISISYASINDTTLCGTIEKALALTEIAEDMLIKARNFYPVCDDGAMHPPPCLTRSRLENYLTSTRNIISEIKSTIPQSNMLESIDFHNRLKRNDSESKPRDCSAVLASGQNKSGVYTIWPIVGTKIKPLNVYCDMDTDGGGWTVIQRRAYFPGLISFNRYWREYKIGFGDVSKDFWLGNDNIYALTNQERCEIRFDLEDDEGNKRFAAYKNFRIDDEQSNYTLSISGYYGNAGDGMKFHDGQRFATRDRDYLTGAAVLEGAWWIFGWAYCHLNGLYIPGIDNPKSIHWYLWKKNVGLASAEMKLRWTTS
ncbi:techylectin-5A [Caerostris darwini]|uniref:Techylectin-5A n=1 Tax=Caerostris darwini TaxID=1538125 RepID=A0AAV4WZD0_9ARAC|nr:techylectin-5A [Caerostris darwini]